MESVRDNSTSWVMPRSWPILPKAGATIDDETGEMKVNEETISVAAHLLRNAQFFGLSGSSGPSQVTYERLISR
jgi:hypothetical protein